jgi:hypothetical protein
MKAWEADCFENDYATDWLAEFSEAPSISLVWNELTLVVDFHRKYLGLPECCAAIAAAEVVAALKGAPNPKLPEEIKEWAGRQAKNAFPDLTALSLKAIEKIKSDWEMKELWDQAYDREEWYSSINNLETRLKSKTPKKSREITPKESLRILAIMALLLGTMTAINYERSYEKMLANNQWLSFLKWYFDLWAPSSLSQSFELFLWSILFLFLGRLITILGLVWCRIVVNKLERLPKDVAMILFSPLAFGLPTLLFCVGLSLAGIVVLSFGVAGMIRCLYFLVKLFL